MTMTHKNEAMKNNVDSKDTLMQIKDKKHYTDWLYQVVISFPPAISSTPSHNVLSSGI